MSDQATAQNSGHQNPQDMKNLLVLHTALKTARTCESDKKYITAASDIKILADQTAKAV